MLCISQQTLQILHEDFCRGHNIMDRLYRDYERGDALDPLMYLAVRG
jgi:hypothetical protein